MYDLDCPPGLQLPLVSLPVSRGEEVSTGAQAAPTALPSVGTAAAWRGAEDPVSTLEDWEGRMEFTLE